MNRDAGMIEWKDDSGKKHVAWFKYHNNEWANIQGYTFEIQLSVGETRYANIKQTVAYVCVDEDEAGNAVVQKWQCKTTFFRDLHL